MLRPAGLRAGRRTPPGGPAGAACLGGAGARACHVSGLAGAGTGHKGAP
jgi:hypothetical protein